MKFVRRHHEHVEINLTPLIDVVFLLLIFFMISTTFDTRQALQLSLPQSSSAMPLESSPLTLSINSEGVYRIGERRYADGDALRKALASRLESAHEHGLVIEADAKTAHAAVVAALDQAAALNIQRVRIATRNPDPPERAEKP